MSDIEDWMGRLRPEPARPGREMPPADPRHESWGWDRLDAEAVATGAEDAPATPDLVGAPAALTVDYQAAWKYEHGARVAAEARLKAIQDRSDAETILALFRGPQGSLPRSKAEWGAAVARVNAANYTEPSPL